MNGDPNQNKKFEAAYLWLLNYITPINKGDRIYTVIIPNFANSSNFKNKGWYLAIYNNTNNEYTLPLSRIKDMPNDKVEVSIDSILIGNILNFNYTTAVMIRVTDTFLAKPPDYLVDSSPDDNLFWSKWFS